MAAPRLIALLALGALGAASGGDEALAIRQVASGRAPEGSPWVRIRLAEPFPPTSADSWYVAVTLETPRGERQALIAEHGGRRTARYLDRDRREAGRVVAHALPGGDLLVILPRAVPRRARFVVSSGQRMGSGRVRRWQRGTTARPMRLATRVQDPLARAEAEPSTPATPAAPAPGEPSAGSAAPSRPRPLVAGGVGAALGFATVLIARRDGDRRQRTVLLLVMGSSAGGIVGILSPLGVVLGMASGLGAAVAFAALTGRP